MLLFEALQAARRYVVLASRRGLVCLRFSRKPFSHIVVLQARIQWRLQLLMRDPQMKLSRAALRDRSRRPLCSTSIRFVDYPDQVLPLPRMMRFPQMWIEATFHKGSFAQRGSFASIGSPTVPVETVKLIRPNHVSDLSRINVLQCRKRCTDQRKGSPFSPFRTI